MSIKYNDKLIAGKYKVQLITPADTVNSGTIKIATQQEVDKGIDNTTAVTPYYLATKQDKLVAGDNILLDENLIECTVYPDDVTIVQNEDGTITNIAQKTVNDTIKIDWVGTTAEYEAGVIDGSIEPHWYCYITDDEQYVDYENLMLADLTNIRQEGIETIDNIVTNNLQKADINLDNITEAGEQVIRDNAGIKFELFDTKLADHVLSYEESLGWGLQGTYVYKDAIAGERFGYPEFYAKCVEEFQNASNTKEYLSSNVNLVGSLVDAKGVLSGFISQSSYATMSVKIPSSSLELVIKAHTPSSFNEYSVLQTDVKYNGLIWRVTSAGVSEIWMSSNGSSNNVADNFNPNLTIPTDRDVWFKVTWDGSKYSFLISTDGANWTTGTSLNNTSAVYWNKPQGLGGGSWESNYWNGGTIDLNGSYLDIDGSRWWSGTNTYTSYNNENGHKFYNIAEKDKIDELYSNFNRAWLYGIDTENERIFLPREKSRYLVDSKKATDEDPSWYNLYSDGWCEQGGNFVVNSASVGGGNYSEKKLDFIKPFIKCTQWHCQPKHDCFIAGFNNTEVTSSANVFQKNTQTSAYTNPFVIWEAKGYCAETPDVNIYKYICVGNVKSSTAWLDVVTQVKNGVKDIEIAREETLNDVETTKDEAIYEIRSNAEDLIKINRLKMFQPLLLDYVLSYNETKGLALQGTYVYKDAIAGSRYGYSTFYEKCVEEFKNASNTKQWLKSNVTKVGSVVDNQGILSGFSSSNYATLPISFGSSGNTWESVICFTTGTDVTTSQLIQCNSVAYWGYGVGIASGKLRIGLSSSTSSFTITENTSTVVQSNTKYWVKTTFNGSSYTCSYSIDGVVWSNIFNITSTSSISSGTPRLGLNDGGIYSFLGLIDLNESYININGSRWWTGTTTVMKNSNKHLFYDIKDKELIDEYYNSTGRAWFYGIDTENERIFLPRNNKYFRIGDADTVGVNQDAGLPNITGSANLHGMDGGGLATSGAFYDAGDVTTAGQGHNSGRANPILGFNASRSNPIYGNSDTVELDSVNMLLYICVGNTEADTSWVDVVTQVENGVLDLENKKNNCIDEINAVGDNYENLTHRNITNCLLEIPQRIKYDLTDGVLTIKKGSQVIVPYGTTNENFTRVGSPTIVDGVASGLNKDNGLITTIDYLKCFKMKVKGVVSETTNTSPQGNIWSIFGIQAGIGVDVRPTAVTIARATNSDGVYALIKEGDVIEVELEQAEENITLKVWINDVLHEKTWASTAKEYTNATLCIGASGVNSIYYWTGSIDLTYFSITVDDKVVYRPYIQKGDRFLDDNFKVVNTEWDGSKFFVWAELQNDVSKVSTDADYDLGVQFRMDTSLSEPAWDLSGGYIQNYASGTTPPTNYKVYYNTDTNLVYATTKTSMIYTLPLMITTGAFGSVKQVFNGFGYIGSTFWVDKGIKGLIPNGRNEDGTLNNIEYKTSKLYIQTVTNFTQAKMPFGIWLDDERPLDWQTQWYCQDTMPSDNYSLWFDTKNNIIKECTDTVGEYVPVKVLICGFISRLKGDTQATITSILPQKTFRAVDKEAVDGQWVQKYMEVMTAVKAIGSYSYDLSNYLPNDGHTYEVLFNSYMNSNNTSYQTFGTVASPKDKLQNCIACELVSTSTGSIIPMQFILPIDASRTVYMQISGAAISTTSYLHATAYRRVGTNI